MCPTPEELLNADGSLLAKAICEAGNKGPKFGAEKAAKLREAAGSAQVIGVRSASNASLIKNVLDIIEGLLAAIQRIEREIKELVCLLYTSPVSRTGRASPIWTLNFTTL